MKKKILLFSLIVPVLFVSQQIVSAHCQIPCGIYDDGARFKELSEHITTVEKSMKLIDELSKEPQKNANQIVRWVINKEDHAEKLKGIVTEYFLCQRIKPLEGGSGDAHEAQVYMTKLQLCHKLLVTSMKAKQTTDQKHVAELRAALKAFKELYEHKH